MIDPIPAHQLCPDCKTERRALSLGLTGYGCLCVPCFKKRMDNAKKKKRPRKGPSKREYSWTDMMDWTEEQRHPARQCYFGCTLCGDQISNLGNMDEL